VKAFCAAVALWCGAVWCGLACAGMLARGAAPPPAIPGPGLTLELPKELQAEAGALVLIEARTSGKAVRWAALDDGLQLVPGRLLASPLVAVAVAARPGAYRVLAVAGAGDELSEPAVCTLRVGPKSEPFRPPPARPAKAWLVIVEETAEASPRRGALLGNAEVRAYLAARGWGLRVADQDVKDASGAAPADLLPYLSRAKGQRLPRLFVVGSDRRLLYEGDLPATPGALLSLLKGIGG
jgi:hypothetical protein